MIFRLAADIVFLLHFAFVIFAVLGGLLVLRRPALLPLHLAAVIWGMLVEWVDWLCPLTSLENYLRTEGNDYGYTGGFVEHYLIPLLYPEQLTSERRCLLALGLFAVNLGIYGYFFLRRLEKH